MNTRPKSTLVKALIAAAVVVPAAAAWAEPALTTQGVNMRAGPDVSYPQVAFLPRGVSVNVVGCVEGYSWCDVIAGGNRGWVYAGYLSSQAYYNGAPGIIAYQGPTLGVPLISFSIGNYWDNYYRGRPWWNNRAYWYNRDHWREPPRYVEGPRYYGGHDNREWHGNNRGNEWHGNRGNENRGGEWHANGSRGNDAGIPSDTYSRAEGGTGRSHSRPNEQQ